MPRRRKTHKEFEQEINTLHPNIKLLSKYTVAKEKVQCECISCGNIWSVRASHLVDGTGCPQCFYKSKKKTNDEFLKELLKCNENIIPLEKYHSALEPIMFKCKIDGHIWKNRPANILQGQKCPICAKQISANKQRKSPAQFVDELQALNPNIEVLGNYINNKTKILCKCKLDGNEWYGIPSNLLNGQGCPICGKKKLGDALKKTNTEFLSEFNSINNNIELLSNYNGAYTKILCRCNVCNHEWSTYPNNLTRGHGCPKCAGLIKTHIDFIAEMEQKHPDIIVLGEYKNAKTPILCKCKIDKNEWFATPNRLLSGTGCPQCNESKGEKIITDILTKNNICFMRQKTFDELYGIGNRNLSYDFHIPSLNILIEFQGEQHYEPIDYFGGEKRFEIQQEHDKRKRKYAKDNNIKLIEIPYWDFENIEEILSKELGLVD